MRTATPAKKSSLQSKKFSLKAFGQGLGIAGIVYLGAFVFIGAQRTATIEGLQARLASRVAPVMRPVVKEPQPVLESANFPPAPTPVSVAVGEMGGPQSPVQMLSSQGQTTSQESSVVAADPVPPAIISLEPSPLQGLYEDTASGRLPKISPTGLTPFAAYKRPFTRDGRPVIALAILEYGLSSSLSEQALSDLPGEVSFILSPYSEQTDDWQRKAREKGHELWLFVPMENESYGAADPGPYAILTTASLLENQNRINWLLSRTTGYAGVVSFTDKVFVEMHSVLENVVKNFFKRGLGYVEMNPQGSQYIETLAVASSMPFADNNHKIDLLRDDDVTKIEAQARNNGYVTAIISGTPRNMQALSAWVKNLETKGFIVAPISAVASMKLEQNATTSSPADVSPATDHQTAPVH